MRAQLAAENDPDGFFPVFQGQEQEMKTEEDEEDEGQELPPDPDQPFVKIGIEMVDSKEEDRTKTSFASDEQFSITKMQNRM